MGEGLGQGHTAPQGAGLRPDPGVPQISDGAGALGGWGGGGIQCSEPGNFIFSAQSNHVGEATLPPPPVSTFNITTQVKYQLSFGQLEREAS